MKRFLNSSIIFSILILTANACAPAPTATIAPSETPSPTLTQTPIPTETPEPPLPPELQSKFDEVGVDLTKMTNAKLDKDGLHITLESGEVVITKEQLAKNSYLGQPVEYNGANPVLQIRDDANENVLFAYDTNTGEFLDSSKYIQKDNSDPEKYIQVAGWDELKALWAMEKMFLLHFDPNNTYFPESNEIFRDYGNLTGNTNNEFNPWYPFGKLPEGMDSPFRYVNFIRMQKE